MGKAKDKLNKKYKSEYPLVWGKKDFFIKIFCSIPNIATGIFLTTDKAFFILDPGDGILRDLNKEMKAGCILGVSDIFISHGHHDHVGGVWSLLTYLSVMKKKTPLNIYYPEGCVEIESIHRAFNEVYQKDLTYQIRLKKINNTRKFQRNNVEIKPFPVLHKERSNDGKSSIRIPSLGYKFFYKGKSICYGGDTSYCETLVSMAKNSDLAIIEAAAETKKDEDLHMSISQAKIIGSTAKKYFLVHVPEE